MKTVADWVTTYQWSDGGWEVRLRESDESQLLVFLDLPRRELAEHYQKRIQDAMIEFAKAVQDGEARL